MDWLILAGAVLLGVGIVAYILMHLTGGESRDAARERRCPLCKSVLGQDETVVAQILTQKPPQQIKIKGCRHCLPHYRDLPPEQKP
jgi:hypothetical protein